MAIAFKILLAIFCLVVGAHFQVAAERASHRHGRDVYVFDLLNMAACIGFVMCVVWIFN